MERCGGIELLGDQHPHWGVLPVRRSSREGGGGSRVALGALRWQHRAWASSVDGSHGAAERCWVVPPPPACRVLRVQGGGRCGGGRAGCVAWRCCVAWRWGGFDLQPCEAGTLMCCWVLGQARPVPPTSCPGAPGALASVVQTAHCSEHPTVPPPPERGVPPAKPYFRGPVAGPLPPFPSAQPRS